MDFREANVYALWSTGRQDLTLNPKQEEGAIFHLHDGPSGRLHSVPHWLWQVVVLTVVALHV